MAPVVFKAYSTPIARASPEVESSSEREVRAPRTASGSVAPMSPVGTSSTANASTARTLPATSGAWLGSTTCATAAYTPCSQPNTSGVSSAVIAIRSSTRPYTNSGLRTWSARRPPTTLPIARPAMNAASTVLMAKIVTPKVKPSSLTHAT